jgi:hypothetical protein
MATVGAMGMVVATARATTAAQATTPHPCGGQPQCIARATAAGVAITVKVVSAVAMVASGAAPAEVVGAAGGKAPRSLLVVAYIYFLPGFCRFLTLNLARYGASLSCASNPY